MIPVTPQPEPAEFDRIVRQPGLAYIAQHPEKSASKLPPYWRKMNRELHRAYHGICAYLAVYFDFATGASSTDHFAPKSKNKQDMYEWRNYRLACLSANRRKNVYKVLDPFTLLPNSFVIDFFDGQIKPNQAQAVGYQTACQQTIDILGLDEWDKRKMRLQYFEDYRNGDISKNWLKRNSPFVYEEMARQNLL